MTNVFDKNNHMNQEESWIDNQGNRHYPEPEPEWVVWFNSHTWKEKQYICRNNKGCFFPIGMDDIPDSDVMKKIWEAETGKRVQRSIYTTAMQEVIDTLKKLKSLKPIVFNNDRYDKGFNDGLTSAIDLCNGILVKEKEQISKAWDDALIHEGYYYLDEEPSYKPPNKEEYLKIKYPNLSNKDTKK